jgi:dipeptidase E
MVMAPRIGGDFVGWKDPALGPDTPRNDTTLGLVDFGIYPHLDCPDLPHNTLANAEKWAAGMGMPCFVIDDETAIQVENGNVNVISEGNWHYLP